ncbi:hypothetical protein RUR49_25820 [Pseudoxanthobacter sp. M-2]|uniref:hypothetical protein n=1 Tax=Pseudoxanthobacter sp. M-2 TaxID=3078754 RepID=UPI0038FC7094
MSAPRPATEPTPEPPFFIGWASLPAALAVPLTFVAAALVAGFAALALGLGASTGDPGSGGFDWAAGRQQMAGVVQARPYPILRLPPSAAHPDGHAVMLAGVGKVGAQAPAEPLDGQAATAAGFLIKRGDLDMLQLDGPEGLVATEAPAGTAPTAAPPPSTPLGRYRLVGELCDGKCYAGAMRPGTGLAHKACANLCLAGGLPLVFVSTGPVEGQVFFLVGDAAGGEPAAEDYRDLVARLVEIEADVEKVDDLLVLKADLKTARVLP